MKFDIDSARKAGYSDDEIADYLASQRNFDLSGAIQSGYSARDVIDYLAGAAPAAAAPDTGDETARLAARYKAPEQPGIIQRVADYLKPAPKSVMEGYVPTPEERQADVDRRLSYGAGPVSSQTAAQADLVRSGMATTDSPVVKKVAKAMDAQGTKSFGDLVQGARRAEEAAAASEGRLPIAYETEFRAAPEPTIFDRVMDFFGPNRDAAAVELAARRIAEEQGISPEEVYKSVGGSRPIFNPEGRAPIRAGVEAAQIIASEIPKVPAGAANTVLRAIRGGEISTDPNSVLNLLVKATDGDKNAFADPNYQAFNGIGKSFGYSLTSMVATATAAAGATLVTGPAGGLAAGSAAGLTTTYRASKDEFLDRVKENLDAKSQKVFGRPMSEQEWSTAKSEFDSAAMRYGAWEAVPETISNLIFLKPFAAPLKAATSSSKVSELANRAIKAAAIDHVPEHVTETLTALGQNRAEIEAGLTTNELTPTEAFKQQAVQTLLMSGGVAGGAKAVKSASDFYQQRVLSPDRQIARAMDQEIANTDFAVPASEVAADLLNPNTYDQRLISPSETVRPAEVVNFTEPDSATAQAGLTPIVVPVPNQAEVPDVGAVDVVGGAAAGGGQLAGDLGRAGLGDAGLTRVDATGATGDGAVGLAPVGGTSAPVGSGAGQRAATVGLPRPLPRATDADLLARTEAAVAAQENNNAVVQPAEQWFGRKGDGYATEADAQQALPGRQRMFKDLDWKIEPMPNGKFRLAGYSKETSLGTQTPQAVQAEAQGQEAATGALSNEFTGDANTALAAGAPAPSIGAAGVGVPAGASQNLAGAQGVGVGGLQGQPQGQAATLATAAGAIEGQGAATQFTLKPVKSAPVTAITLAVKDIQRKDGVEVAPVQPDQLTEQQIAAQQLAAFGGSTMTFLRRVSGPAEKMPNALTVQRKHVMLDVNTEDAPLFAVAHELGHNMPDRIRKPFVAAMNKYFKPEMRSEFQREFRYAEAETDEEITMYMVQALTKRESFWSDLKQELGNKDFAEFAKYVAQRIGSWIKGVRSEYGQGFIDKYMTDADAAQKVAVQYYAQAMREQGLTPDAEVTDGVMASNRTQEPEIGAKLQQRIDTDFEGAAQEYSQLKGTKGGRVLDTDIARELSPEYRENRNRSAEVHEAASDFIQRSFEQRMAQPGTGDIVAFMAGGGGSGKSSAETLLAPVLDRASTVLDGTLSSYDKARRNVQLTLDSGRQVRIAYVYREPEEAMRNGVLTRAMRGGRTVPVDALVKGHAGSSDVVRKLQAEFGDNPKFKIFAVDNSRGPGAAQITPLENITPVIIDGLKERFINATEDEYKAGRISESVYRATLGRQADAAAGIEGEAGGRAVRQGSRGDVQEGRGLERAGDEVARSNRVKKAGSYTYTVDDKGRITVTGDSDRIRFLTKAIAKGTVTPDGEAVMFRSADADAAIKALKSEPKADPTIAANIQKQLNLSDEELASTSLEYQTGEPKDRAFVAPLKGGVPETVQFLEERRRASGLRLLDIAKPEDQDTLAKLIAAETMAAIRSSGNALEWYDETIAKTLAMAAVKYPELGRDVNAQMAFRLGMAIASQGLNVENNLKLAMRQYEAFRNTGKFPEIGEGESAEAMAGNFRLANDLMAEMGPDLFRRFLATPFTIGELNSAGFDPGGELVDEEVLGSSVFGPKIGFGFYSNLNGNFEPVTMDMWFMRTMGRLTGYLRAFDAEKFSGQIKRFRDSFDQRGADGVYADQFDADLIEAARTDEDSAIALARQVKKAHEKDFKTNREAFDAKQRKKTSLVLAAETMIQSIDKPKDVPGSGTERRQMRQVVRKAVDLVEQAYGQRVPPAAMQALIWYPEQELYKALGVKLSVTSQDYAGATEKVLKDEGYDEQQLRTAAKSGARRVRQANARDERRAAQGDGQRAGRTGPLEGAERGEFVRSRYERFQLEKERLNPTRKGVVFEVAPDPNNEELTNRWRSLEQSQRLEISERVAREIVPKVLGQFQSSGIVTAQVGSYLDDTNPSFTVLLDKGDAVEIAKQLGFVLAQDSMVVISPKAFKGGDKVGAIAIELGDKSPAEVDQIYQTLREIEVNGNKPIAGQSMANGVMTILNYSDVPTQQLAILIDQKLNNRYTVMTRDVFAAFPEKKEYDYGRETDDGRGSRADLRKGARALRTEATAALERELAGVTIQRSNRASGSAELARGPSARSDEGTGRTVTGIHYGKAAGLSRLSGTAFGSGIKGAEQARLNEPGVDPRIKKRVYFYLTNNNADMPRPEIGLGSHVYRATLGNMFDMATATAADKARVQSLRKTSDANGFESAVLDAGFRGYVNREQGTAVVLNADVPVAYEGLAEAGRMRDRVIQRVQQGPVTRTEGDELVRKPTNDEMMGIIKARPALATAAPSFKLQFGDARVLASEAAEADRVLAEAGAGFQFGDVMRSNRVIGSEDSFDTEQASISKSNRIVKRQKLIGTNFTMESSSATDAARIKLQDDGLRMKRVIEAVKAKGGKVTEAQNFYDANTLMPGRIQAAIDDFKTDVVKPMLDKAAEYGIDLDELSMYAYAKHAKERNAYIASINKRMPDGGSGMTNDEADNILQMVDLAGDTAKFEELHQMLMGITSATRQIMLTEGLITQDEFNQLEGAYENYIPLRGFENVDEETGVARPGIGRGINVRGGETIRALGRKSKAGDLIENVIRDYERVIMRVEKNDVGKVLLDFVLSNPDPDLWGVDVERNKAGFNKALGTVQYTKAVEKGEDTIGIKVGGQQVYIKLADKELARALRQAWKDETSGLERATLAMTGWWNNWMRAVLTKYNPAFAAINIPRDALWSGTAAALDDLGAKGLGLYLKNYGKALMASSRQELGVSGSTNPVFGNPQVDRMFQEFRAAGGITGGLYMRSLKDINQDLRNELLLAGASARNPWEAIKSLPPFKLAKLTLKMLEFMGAASENATRFALYMTSREMGNTPTKAALLAKDGTTNFNRKGEWGGALNNLYLFFNAAVQGNAQLVKVLKNRKVQAAMAGVSGVGMMLALYGATAGGEDDDGEKYWDKIPSYVKERNLVIMLSPGEPLVDGIERVGKRGRYITIPVQYGFNIFPNLGYMMADVLRNAEDKRRGVTPTKAALHMTSLVFGSVNPFGGAVDVSDGVQVLLAAMPTITDLPIQLINERNTFGSPSAPAKSPFDKRPDSERMFTSQQGTVPAKIAKTLNELGGGNEGKTGSIMGVETSMTPGTVETLISATTGGLGSFVEQIGSSVMAMSGDEKDLKANKVPFLNKFYGEVDESANIRSAAERMAQIRKLSDEVKAQQKVGIDPELKDDEQKLMALAGMQESYQRQQAMMRKAELEIIKDTKMTDAQKTLERRKLQVERDKLATEVNRAYLQATK